MLTLLAVTIALVVCALAMSHDPKAPRRDDPL
jgi:hypothetical protein